MVGEAPGEHLGRHAQLGSGRLPQPHFYGLAEILVKVLQVTHCQLAKITVSVFVRADDTVDICRGESQVDRKPSPSELVRFPREGDCTGRVRHLFAMVLEGYALCRLYTEKVGTPHP